MDIQCQSIFFEIRVYSVEYFVILCVVGLSITIYIPYVLKTINFKTSLQLHFCHSSINPNVNMAMAEEKRFDSYPTTIFSEEERNRARLFACCVYVTKILFSLFCDKIAI